MREIYSPARLRGRGHLYGLLSPARHAWYAFAMSTPVDTYLAEIARYYADPHSSEISYRSAFQNFLDSIFPKEEKYHIQHDPKAINGNKPDFIVLRHGVPLLYIEVKKPGEDLDKIERSAQAVRYFGYANLIISDYGEFRFYRNGERYGDSIALATYQSRTHTLDAHPHKVENLTRTLHDFIMSKREPIVSGKHLAKIMGGKAQRIRENIIAFLDTESTEKDEIMRMMHYIKSTLITHLTREDFADMYAQTLVYGLFAARHHDSTLDTFTRAEALDLIPATNPFLKHFFGHIAGPSFPTRLRYIVDELCDVFMHADVRTLMQEYFKQGALFSEDAESPDPVIHFYEDFLQEYNPAKKMEMGVFYTPLPVVRFIVSGIDELLKREFGVEKGIADTSRTVREIEVPQINGAFKKVRDDSLHRVQILDVATGTGTFLNEAVKHIHGLFTHNAGRWASYVEQDLLPRLHGFELMMASYTIAHLKLGMTLEKDGILKTKGRLGIYLTNTLDEPHDLPLQSSLFGVVESIAEESKFASRVKREYPIMVVMGNPPYSGESMNPHYTAHDVYKVEPGGIEKLKEKNSKWLNDDYVKFIRFAESMVERNGEGVVGMITAHGYLDNPTFRGMRWHLRKTFTDIFVLDLHGNANKKECAPDGGKDENVFDIKTGVAVIFGVKKVEGKKTKQLATVHHAELYGTRGSKFEALTKADMSTVKWKKLPTDTDVWRVEGKGKAEYIQGFSVAELFPVNSVGIVTARDGMSIQYSKVAIERVVGDFENENVETLRTKYELGKDVRDWSVAGAKKDVARDDGVITQIAYRPFDIRWTYYTGRSKGFHCMPRGEVMKHFVVGENVGLIAMRQATDDSLFNQVVLTNSIVDNRYMYSGKGITIQMPLYLYADDGTKTPNLSPEIVARIEEVVGHTTPEDLLDYVYAYLHAPSYRKAYSEFLKSDFPRVPYPKSKEQFRKLVPLGTKLRHLHLLTAPEVARATVSFPCTGSNMVEKVVQDGTRVYINATQYFEGVPKDVFAFYIGGYQPAQKYLKDRKGRVLTNAEFEQYEKIIASLSNTIEVMCEIDREL